MRTTGCIHDGWLVLSDKSGLFDQDYLYYFLGSAAAYKQFDNLAAGATVRNLNTELVKRVTLPLPPLPEQQHIVAILDEAFAGLATATANAEKNLKNARELLDSYLNSIFEQKANKWEVRTVRDLCELVSGQHIDAKDYTTLGKGLGYLTGPSDFGAIHPVVSKWTEVPKRTARKEDILLTVKGSGVGSINLLDANEVAISRQLMAVRPRAANRDFLFYFLSQQQAHFQTLANGTTIPGIFREDVLDLPIVTPARTVQDKVVMAIKQIEDQVRRLEDYYASRLTDIGELKQSILQKAFSGELTSPPSSAIPEAAE